MPYCPKLIVFCKGQKLMEGGGGGVVTESVQSSLKKKQSVVGGENQKCQI